MIVRVTTVFASAPEMVAVNGAPTVGVESDTVKLKPKGLVSHGCGRSKDESSRRGSHHNDASNWLGTLDARPHAPLVAFMCHRRGSQALWPFEVSVMSRAELGFSSPASLAVSTKKTSIRQRRSAYILRTRGDNGARVSR